MTDRDETGERPDGAAEQPTVPLDRSTGARLVPADPVPVVPAPVDPAPVDPGPADSAPAGPARVGSDPDEPTVPMDYPVDDPDPKKAGPGEISDTSPDPSIYDTPEVVPEKSDLDRADREQARGEREGSGVTLGIKRPAPAGTLIWVLLALLGFTLVVQLRSNDADYGLATARQEDLVRILSDLEAQDSRLLADIQALESTRQQLSSGVQGREAALLEATKRGEELGLLAGTLPGRGPGLEILLEKVKASDVLNAVQELRGARGEVMQLNGANGAAVRVVASSYFVDASGGGIIADGEQLTGPFRLLVIGQPETMRTALQIPGGVVASVQKDGGSVTMDSRSLVEVTEVRKAASLQHARPVS